VSDKRDVRDPGSERGIGIGGPPMAGLGKSAAIGRSADLSRVLGAAAGSLHRATANRGISLPG
jgi:hypothetical protein